MRYLAFNPVRARLCVTPGEWEWSSVRAHLRRRDDALVDVRPVLAIARRFGDLLDMSPGEQAELAGFESLESTAARSAMRHSWPSPSESSAVACARASRDRNPGRRGQ